MIYHKNIVIKQETRLYEAQLLPVVRRALIGNEPPVGRITTIFIEQRDVSDLFVCRKYAIRKCNAREWVEYFYTFLAEPKARRKKRRLYNH